MLAERYAALLLPPGSRVCERSAIADLKKIGELEIQARWFAGEFGSHFLSTRGDRVEIVQFGVWNHEAGPDFAEAAISLNGEPPQRGSIELDHDVRDWERHHHSSNPDYNAVVLHVFTQAGPAEFFTRTLQHVNVPQVLLRPLETMQPMPNPLPLAKPGKCLAPLQGMAPERVAEILEAAAQFRMCRKSEQLQRMAALHGEDEALYQVLAGTLGYKSNKLPFTLLAQRLPLRLLRKNPAEIEALLFGVSGFLGQPDLGDFSHPVRSYLRTLWEQWWGRRAEFERLTISKLLWRLNGHRPANHPQRRLAALAQIVRHWEQLRPLRRGTSVAAISAFFNRLHDHFWEHHYTLSAQESSRPMALVGRSRIVEMLANAFFPLALAADPAEWGTYRILPAALTNRRVETAGLRLFGSAAAARPFTRTVAHQQGLLQIYEDFCMQDNSDCQQCLFPARAAAWS